MNTSKLYQLIVAPQYRLWRHLALILTLVIITFNQIFIAYQDSNDLLGNKIYLICLLSFVTYLGATYINYFFLIRKLILKEKYVQYIICLVILVFSLLFVHVFLEYAVRTYLNLPHRIASYVNPLILVDSLASSTITIMCFGSMSAITLFRKWNDKSKHISELEYNFLQSEVNKLKGQISPTFLSQALQASSHSASLCPELASDILMQVSQLLRYQLYDCQRDKVLLSSEINFITNFLETKKLITDNDFVYSIETKGNTNSVLIAPLLLIVLVQAILTNDKVSCISLINNVSDNSVLFSLTYNENFKLPNIIINEMQEKLELLYPAAYTLCNKQGEIQLQLIIG